MVVRILNRNRLYYTTNHDPYKEVGGEVIILSRLRFVEGPELHGVVR